MKAEVLFLVTILASVCTGLQPGLEYTYRYSGRVATGRTDIRTQFAAAGIQADVTIQVSEDYTAIVQFTHVEVGDFHDEITCDSRAPLPIEYHSLEYAVDLLQLPFKVKLDGDKKPWHFEFLEVPQEPVWITNIRKAIVNIFKIAPFGHETGPGSLIYHDLGSFEETIVGSCFNWYDINKLPEEDTAIFNRDHEIEDDVQREGGGASGSLTGTKGRKGSAKGHRASKSSKSSRTSKTSKSRYTSRAPELNDSLWNVVRTTDFDKCKYMFGAEVHVNKATEDLISRMSVGTYIIRGDSEAARIEKAFIEGSITVFTQEDRREHYDTFTNQTLDLKAVRTIGEELTVDYEVQHFTSWRFQGDASSFGELAAGELHSYEQTLTGIKPTADVINEIKTQVIASIEHVVNRHSETASSPTATLVEEIAHVVDGVSDLSYADLLEIEQKLHVTEEAPSRPNQKLIIFYQSLISSGTNSAIRLLIEKVTKEEFWISNPGIVGMFFADIGDTIKTPSIIPEIMEAVMKVAPEGPDMKMDFTLPVLSFANLLGDMCFNPQMAGDQCFKPITCDKDAVASAYIPFLQERLQNEDLRLWQRFIYLKALSALRTPLVLDILKPYILGSEDFPVAFRKTAIYALIYPRMPLLALGEIKNWLMTVFDNIQENHEVRTTAFLVLASWETSHYWWSEMAVTTWREPNHKVANFISTTIKSSANLKDGGKLTLAARKVLHLIKPPAPAALTLSANYYILDYIHAGKNDKFLSYAWMADAESILPTQIDLRLSLVKFFGYSREITIDTLLTLMKWSMQMTVSMFQSRQSTLNQDAFAIVKGMYDEILEKLGYEQFQDAPDPFIAVKISNAITALYGKPEDGFIVPNLEHIFNYVRHYRDRDAIIRIPTDLGLPFIAEHVVENAFWNDITLTPGTERKKITLEFSKRMSLEVKTIVPWSQKFAIGTKTEKVGSITLPLAFQYKNPKGVKELQVTLEPRTENKIDILEFRKIPTTVQYGAFPTHAHYQSNEYKLVQKKRECPYDAKGQVFPPAAGLALEWSYKGDVSSPFSLKNLFSGDPLRFIEASNYWEGHVTFDPSASTTKSVTITGTYVSTDKKSGGLVEVGGELTSGQSSVDYGDYTQFSQSSSDADYSQFSQSSSSDTQEFGGDVDVFGQEQQSATRARIAKLQEQVVPASGGHVKSISLDFDLHGPPNKKYAALFTWAAGVSSARRHSKVQLTWIDDVPTGSLGEAHSTCLNLKIEKPFFVPFESPEDVLATNFHSTFAIDLHQGSDCGLPAIVEVEGSMDVSPEYLAEARKKLTEPHCDGKPDLLPIELITTPIYDHIYVNAHWNEDLPVSFKNLTYWAYDIIRGLQSFRNQYDYTTHGTKNEIIFDATKCHETEKWTVHSVKPHEVSVAEKIKAPYIFNLIASPASAWEKIIFDRLNGRMSEACIISHDNIRTFDGVVYPYEVSECWNVLALETSGHDLGIFEVRFHDEMFEIRILFPTEALLLEMTHNSFKVNGESYDGDDHRFNLHPLSDGNLLIFHFLTIVAVKITEDRIYYLEDHILRGKVHGLCGDFNGEQTAELIGPKGCIYTNTDLFIKAWTTPGEGCSGFTYLAKKRPVEEYQDVCPRKGNVPTGVAYPELLEEHCMTWAYKEMEVGERHCKSFTPVPSCDPGCHSVQTSKTIVSYDCELTDTSATNDPTCIVEKIPTEVPLFCIHD